eukprot:342303-Pelagomonas_calceolata.AAC.2
MRQAAFKSLPDYRLHLQLCRTVRVIIYLRVVICQLCWTVRIPICTAAAATAASAAGDHHEIDSAAAAAAAAAERMCLQSICITVCTSKQWCAHALLNRAVRVPGCVAAAGAGETAKKGACVGYMFLGLFTVANIKIEWRGPAFFLLHGVTLLTRVLTEHEESWVKWVQQCSKEAQGGFPEHLLSAFWTTLVRTKPAITALEHEHTVRVIRMKPPKALCCLKLAGLYCPDVDGTLSPSFQCFFSLGGD